MRSTPMCIIKILKSPLKASHGFATFHSLKKEEIIFLNYSFQTIRISGYSRVEE
jgi:hypothetical protein